LKPLQKLAAFLVIIGIEKGRSIIELMDSHEINAVISEIRNLMELSQDIQKSVLAEFEQLGYDDKMSPSETLGTIRLLFNGSKISDINRSFGRR